jgi:hypothetical protein
VEQAKEGLKGKNKVTDKRLKQSESDLKDLNTEMMKVNT